jgi:hypothetical protein
MNQLIAAEVAPTTFVSASRNLREVHLDLLLLEEFETNLGFTRRVFEIAFKGQGLPIGWPSRVHVRRSVWDSGGESCPLDRAGENDLDVTAIWEPGEERRIIIEDKVRAGFQIDQALRYLARATSRAPHTRCLLVAPGTFLEGHPGAVNIFGEYGAAVAIEDLAREIETTPLVAASRVAWRVNALRNLTIGRARTPDHPPTVAFSAWCLRWLAGWATCVVPFPIRTINEGWMYVGPGDALIYKCVHGRVDLQLNRMGPDLGIEEVRRRIDGTLPLGFAVAADDSDHTVLRYACEKVSPQSGVGLDGDPIHVDGVKDALIACVTITRWLEERGGRSILFDEMPGATASAPPEKGSTTEPVADLTPLLGARFENALLYAARVHADHVRKGGTVPYVSHLMAVASLVLEDGGGEDEAIAALLHDAIEDRGVKAYEIAERFGQTVASIVVECSGPMGDENGTWRERKQANIDQVGEATPAALRVEAADKVHNARAILADYRRVGKRLWDVFHAPNGRDDVLWYYREMATAFRKVTSGFLVDELERTLATLEEVTGDVASELL